MRSGSPATLAKAKFLALQAENKAFGLFDDIGLDCQVERSHCRLPPFPWAWHNRLCTCFCYFCEIPRSFNFFCLDLLSQLVGIVQGRWWSKQPPHFLHSLCLFRTAYLFWMQVSHRCIACFGVQG